MPTKGYRTLAERDAQQLTRAVESVVYDERPAKVFFAEAVMGALDEYVDAKMEYAASRRDPDTAEYANPDPVSKAAERLQTLLGRVRFAL